MRDGPVGVVGILGKQVTHHPANSAAPLYEPHPVTLPGPASAWIVGEKNWLCVSLSLPAPQLATIASTCACVASGREV